MKVELNFNSKDGHCLLVIDEFRSGIVRLKECPMTNKKRFLPFQINV